MHCILLLEGLNFLITEIPFEVFTYSETNPMCFEETPEDPFPYMVMILQWCFKAQWRIETRSVEPDHGFLTSLVYYL